MSPLEVKTVVVTAQRVDVDVERVTPGLTRVIGDCVDNLIDFR